jgi:hypothetical protein
MELSRPHYWFQPGTVASTAWVLDGRLVVVHRLLSPGARRRRARRGRRALLSTSADLLELGDALDRDHRPAHSGEPGRARATAAPRPSTHAPVGVGPSSGAASLTRAPPERRPATSAAARRPYRPPAKTPPTARGAPSTAVPPSGRRPTARSGRAAVGSRLQGVNLRYLDRHLIRVA